IPASRTAEAQCSQADLLRRVSGNSKFTIDAVFRAVDRFTAPIRKMRSSVDHLSRAAVGLKTLDNGFASVNRSLMKMAGVGLVAGAGFAVGAGTVVAAGASFEQAIVDVGKVSLRSRDDIAAL